MAGFAWTSGLVRQLVPGLSVLCLLGFACAARAQLPAVLPAKSQTAAQTGQVNAAVVVDIRGDWAVEKDGLRRPVALAAVIPDGASLVPLSPDASIIFITGGGRRFKYPDLPAYGANATVYKPGTPIRWSDGGGILDWWQAVVDVFSGASAGFVAPITKYAYLDDAVVPLFDGRPDFRAVFKGAAPGVCRFELRAPQSGAALSASGEISVAAGGEVKAKVKKGAVSRGSYLLDLYSGEGSRQGQVVVVLRAVDEIESTREKLSKFASDLADLSPSVVPPMRKALLRAYMIAME